MVLELDEDALLAREELLLLANRELLAADELMMINRLEEDELTFELEILDIATLLMEDIADVVELEAALDTELLELGDVLTALILELRLTELLLDAGTTLAGVSF